jgi:hypothetical protein
MKLKGIIHIAEKGQCGRVSAGLRTPASWRVQKSISYLAPAKPAQQLALSSAPLRVVLRLNYSKKTNTLMINLLPKIGRQKTRLC